MAEAGEKKAPREGRGAAGGKGPYFRSVLNLPLMFLT